MRGWRVESVVILCWRTVADDLLQMVILWCLWSLGINAKIGVFKGRHIEGIENETKGGRDWFGSVAGYEQSKEFN
jgi:hypothetical protein